VKTSTTLASSGGTFCDRGPSTDRQPAREKEAKKVGGAKEGDLACFSKNNRYLPRGKRVRKKQLMAANPLQS